MVFGWWACMEWRWQTTQFQRVIHAQTLWAIRACQILRVARERAIRLAMASNRARCDSTQGPTPDTPCINPDPDSPAGQSISMSCVQFVAGYSICEDDTATVNTTPTPTVTSSGTTPTPTGSVPTNCGNDGSLNSACSTSPCCASGLVCDLGQPQSTCVAPAANGAQGQPCCDPQPILTVEALLPVAQVSRAEAQTSAY